MNSEIENTDEIEVEDTESNAEDFTEEEVDNEVTAMAMDNEIDNEFEDNVESDPIGDMIDAIGNEDYNNASDVFQSEIGNRLSDVLNQAKIDVASRIFNPVEIEQEEQEEMEDAEV